MIAIDTKFAESCYGLEAAVVCRKVGEAVQGKASTKARAEAAYAAIRELSQEWGQNPDIETLFRGPNENGPYPHGKCYVVGWESGPFEWAIAASEACAQAGVFVEPYYSFDLCFYPGES